MVEIRFRIDRRNGVPAYQQIVLQAKQALRMGTLLPGDRLPTAQEVAEVSGVNPNTTLKAYRELEREGLVEPRPGKGTFVRKSLARPQAAADAPLRAELAAWMDRALAAGFERDDVTALVATVLEERFPWSAAATGAAPHGGDGERV
ncbi:MULTISPECIES: GntR family transcriptional regulator [Streptomyces]|uniref:GntR family transcriptional regulator n=1 Tax=Streptomyces TaxID=1883 RepID=UPI00167BAEDA|nr:GntR family transcriptional regulator [Streptomyces canarius]